MLDHYLYYHIVMLQINSLILVSTLFLSPVANAADIEDLLPALRPNPCNRQLVELMKMRNSSNESAEQYLARRKILEANLPAYSSTAKSIYFHYDIPGLRISIEHGPYFGSHMSGVEPKDFSMQYDPSKFFRTSIIRRTLGSRPRNLTFNDVEAFSQTGLMSDEGTIFEVYLKGGGLIMVARDTGRLLFYPPGTNVDGELGGIVRGSIGAVWNFAKGLAGEAQCAICKYEGTWFTDQDVIDVAPNELPRNLPATE